MINCKKVAKFLIVLAIFSIYIFPMDLSLFISNSNRYEIFHICRNIFIIGSIFIIIFIKNEIKIYMYTVLLIGLIIMKYLLYKELDLGILYIGSSLMLVYYILNNTIEKSFLRKILNYSYYVFVFQILIYTLINSTINGKIKIISSFNDSNYTGYFLLILAMYFFYKNNIIRFIILSIIGIFTYSRMFILCLVLFLVSFLLLKKKKLKISKNIIYSMKFYLFIQFIVILISIIYVLIYESNPPEYVYREGFSRLLNMVDKSNYIRCLANLLALSSVNFITMFIGIKENMFIGLHMFSNKSIFPHNLFWGLFVQYGFIITIIFIKKYIDIFRRYSVEIIPYFIVLIVYQSFLGLSSFYGMDLIIQLVVLMLINEENERSLISEK